MTEGSAGEATPDKRPSADGGPVDWSAFVNTFVETGGFNAE